MWLLLYILSYRTFVRLDNRQCSVMVVQFHYSFDVFWGGFTYSVSQHEEIRMHFQVLVSLGPHNGFLGGECLE